MEAVRGGVVTSVDNRRLAKVAKLAGAPTAAAAGVDAGTRIGDRVDRGQPLYSVHAQSRGELDYALEYARSQSDIFAIDEGDAA